MRARFSKARLMEAKAVATGVRAEEGIGKQGVRGGGGRALMMIVMVPLWPAAATTAVQAPSRPLCVWVGGCSVSVVEVARRVAR